LAAKIPNPNSRGILTSGDEIFGGDFWKCFSVSAAGIRFDKTKGLDVDNVVDRVIPLLIDLHDDQCRDTKKNAATGALDVDDMMPEQRKQIDSADQAAASLAAESELLTNGRKKRKAQTPDEQSKAEETADALKKRRELVAAEAKKGDDLDEMLSNVLKCEASSDQIERELQQQVKKSQTYSEIWILLVNAASWNTEECYHEFAETRERDGWVDSQMA
jgi:hypothetical protein